MTFPMSVGPIRRQVEVDRTSTVYYARPGGSDDNGGTNSTTDAVATWECLFGLLDRFPQPGQHQVLDGTGVDLTVVGDFTIPSVYGTGIEENVTDFGQWNGLNSALYDYPLEFRAHPEQVLAVTVTGTTTAAKGGTHFVTVSETLVVDAHVGQNLLGGGVFEGGTIVSNTANVLSVASATGSWTGSVYITKQSSKWTFGNIADSFSTGLGYIAQCSTVFNGIEIDTRTANTNFTLIPLCYVSLVLCRTNNLLVTGGSSVVQTDYCYFTDAVGQNGACVHWRSSVIKDVFFNVHGSGATGLTGFLNVEFDGCGTLSSNNANSSAYRFGLDTCHFNNSTSDAVSITTPLRAGLDNCYFENIAGDCIKIIYGKGGILRVVGCTNDVASCTGWGLRIANGAVVQSVGSPTLEGTLGEILLGVKTVTWSVLTTAQGLGDSINDLDQGDKTEMCRIF